MPRNGLQNIDILQYLARYFKILLSEYQKINMSEAVLIY